MKVRAKLSFSGLISMHTGQEREIDNEDILKDLIEAGYIEPVSLPVKIENEPQIEETETVEEIEKVEEIKAEIVKEKPVKKPSPGKKKA